MLFRRVLTAAVIASTAILGTSACSMMSPIASLKEYAPSDGTQADLGSVKVRNVMILTNSKNPNVYGLIGSFVNSTNKDQIVVLGYDNAPSQQIKIKAYSVYNLGHSGTKMILLSLPKLKEPSSWAGKIVKMNLASATEDVLPVDINVPVFDEFLPGYQDLINALPSGNN